MQTRKRIAQALVVLGSLVLFVVGAVHGFAGYPEISRALAGTAIPGKVIGGLKLVWLLASWHWITLGVIALVLAFSEAALRRALLLLCGFIVLVDAALAFAAVGPFIGDKLLTVAAVALLAGAALFPAAQN
jgi:hypothetical protein